MYRDKKFREILEHITTDSLKYVPIYFALYFILELGHLRLTF